MQQSLDLIQRKIFGLEFIDSNLTTTFFLDNVNILSDLNIASNINIYNDSTINSKLLSNNITINNILSCNSTIYISNNSIINNNLNIISNLYSNKCIFNNNVTLNSNIIITNLASFNNLSSNNLYIKTNTLLNGNVTVNNNLLISGYSICNNLNVSNNLNISNNSVFNNVTILSNLNIYKSLIINDSCTINSFLFSNRIITVNNSTFMSNLYTNTMIGNNINANNGIFSTLKVSGAIYSNSLSFSNFNGILKDYPDNTTALANNIPIWGLYRTGGIIKICINTIENILILNGDNIINLYIDDTFIDPGAVIINNINGYILNISGSVITQYQASYIRYYNAVDLNNNIICSISRTINIYNYPVIVSIILYDTNIIITNSGIYNNMSYMISNNNINIIPNTEITNTVIDVSSLPHNINQYLITVYLKDILNRILSTKSLFFII